MTNPKPIKFSIFHLGTAILLSISLTLGWMFLNNLSKQKVDSNANSVVRHNATHNHLHVHDGNLDHDHQHVGVSLVTHAHEHEHGHNHDVSLMPQAAGQLVSLGHVHGENDESTTMYWADVWRSGGVLEIKFIAQVGDKSWTIFADSDQLAGELFFETQSLGMISFSKNEEVYEASLVTYRVEAERTLVTIPQLSLEGEPYSLKFLLPLP